MLLGNYMTYEYTIIYTRPDTNTPFYTIPQTVVDYINTVWRVDDKFLTSESLTEDGCTKISNVIFKDISDWLEFIDDPIIKSYIADRNVYHEETGITITRLEG